MSLGSNIRDIRKSKHLTQEQFGIKISDLTGGNPPSKGNVAAWENDKISPTFERMEAIAKIGNTDLKALGYSSDNIGDTLKRIEDKLDILLENKKTSD